jgi:fructose-specific phosphotransferase system IIC component
VLVSCLAYIALVQVAIRLPLPVPPWLALIVLMLHLVAGIVAGFIVSAIVVALTFTPFIRKVYPETPWAERSDKAKEKFADSVLSVGNAIMSAASIAVFVVPLTAFLQAMVSRTDFGAVLSPFLKPDGLPGWQVILLCVLLFLPILVGGYFRKCAMDIYDEIAKPATPAPAIGPNGATPTTHAPPASADTPAA